MFYAGSSTNAEMKCELKEEQSSVSDDLALNDKDVQPVGQDYIEEIKNDEGKFV